MATQQTFSFFDTETVVADAPVATGAGLAGRKSAGITRKPVLAKRSLALAAAPQVSMLAHVPITTEVLARPDVVLDPQVSAQPSISAAVPTRDAILGQLRRQVGCVQQSAPEPVEVFSTGCAGLDKLLPQGGLKRDAVTEWVGETEWSGAAALAMVAATVRLQIAPAQVQRVNDVNHRSNEDGARRVSGPIVVVDSEGTFYPPGAAALGVPLERVVWVRPRRHADVVWAIDQALRCGSVAVVWASVGLRLDDRDARRLQLAAEAGRTPGLFVRPAGVRGKPSFADTRFHVRSAMYRAVRAMETTPTRSPAIAQAWRVTVDRCRGAGVGAGMWMGMDDEARLRPLLASDIVEHHETSAVHLASRLADPAIAGGTNRRRSGNASQQRRA